jgi:hypothetical protein
VSNSINDKLQRLEAIKGEVSNGDMKLLLEAFILHTSILNDRLEPIEQALAITTMSARPEADATKNSNDIGIR